MKTGDVVQQAFARAVLAAARLTRPSTGDDTHVRFDWEVHADRKLLRMLTPVLRPLFRWNHNWGDRARN